jgi:hypothetical protein
MKTARKFHAGAAIQRGANIELTWSKLGGLHVDGEGGGTATLVEVGPTTLGVNGDIDFE